MAAEKFNVHKAITDRILVELRSGAAPWVKPWREIGTGKNQPMNAVSGRPYSGGNVILLWIAAAANDFPTHMWLTYDQAIALGGHVRKGEKSTMILFTKTYVKKAKKPTEQDETRFVARGYRVFNISQCDGLPEKLFVGKAPLNTAERDELAEEFVKATGVVIRENQGLASYSSKRDDIGMPAYGVFKTRDHYYATLFRELGHWTGSKKRLDRDMKSKYGDSAHAMEELVAELTSAFLCAEFDYNGDLRHAGYIETWIGVLEKDDRAFMRAASAAQKAADYLRGLALKDAPTEDGGEHGGEEAVQEAA
jgi:antirestriction protein ArdC